MNDLLRANKKIIARSVAQLRKENHMTQTQLADELNARLNTNYQGSAISAWENANNSINADYLPVLADIFNVALEKLFGESLQQRELVKDVCETIERHLTDEETQQVSHYISYLLYRRYHKILPVEESTEECVAETAKRPNKDPNNE